MINYLDAKLMVYESFDNGYITESEKDDLLYMIEAEDSGDAKATAKKVLKTIGLLIAFLVLAKLIFESAKIAKKDIVGYNIARKDLNKLEGYIKDLKIMQVNLHKKFNDKNISDEDLKKYTQDCHVTAKNIYKFARETVSKDIVPFGTTKQFEKAEKLLDRIQSNVDTVRLYNI